MVSRQQRDAVEQAVSEEEQEVADEHHSERLKNKRPTAGCEGWESALKMG